jgi:hypothetical protein
MNQQGGGNSPSTMSIVALILGIIGLGPVGIVLAVIAKNNGDDTGLNTAALIVSIVGTVLIFLPLFACVVCVGCVGCAVCGSCAYMFEDIMWEIENII